MPILDQPKFNTPPNLDPQPQEHKSFLMRHLVAEVLGIVLAGAVLAGGYWYYTTYLHVPETQTPVHVPKPDPYKDWKTYTNTEYGYEIKYPPTWEFQEENMEHGQYTVLVSADGKLVVMVGIDGAFEDSGDYQLTMDEQKLVDQIISTFKSIQPEYSIEITSGGEKYTNHKFGFEIIYDRYTFPDGISEAESFGKKAFVLGAGIHYEHISIIPQGEFDYGIESEPTSTKNIVFGGKKAEELIYKDVNGPGHDLRIIYIKEVPVNWSEDNRIEIRVSKEKEQNVNQILSTFKFIEPVVINSYASCIAAGYPMMKSFPPKCAANGMTWVEPQGACIQVIAKAKNPETGETREFPTPCDIPEGWSHISDGT